MAKNNYTTRQKAILGGFPGEVPLTPEEEKAIAILHSLAKKWPKSLWLYSASGTLNVMRNLENGERANEGYFGGGRNIPNDQEEQDYIVAKIDIQNDGGDW